jgi:hypothetical protein
MIKMGPVFSNRCKHVRLSAEQTKLSMFRELNQKLLYPLVKTFNHRSRTT